MPPLEHTLNDEQASSVRKYLEDHEKTVCIRLLMLGEHGVGKYNLVPRLNCDGIIESYDPTYSSDFAFRRTVEGKNVIYEGDTTSPSAKWTAANYPDQPIAGYGMLRHCEACMFVYDVGNKASFEAVKRYHDNLHLERSLERQLCVFRCAPCRPRPSYQGLIFVIANKIDREGREWEVTTREGEEYCASIGAIFIPMSAKTGEGGGKDNLDAMTKHILLRRASILSSSQATRALENAAFPSPRELVGTDFSNQRFWY